MLILAQVGLPNSLPYWEPNLGPIRETRCLPYTRLSKTKSIGTCIHSGSDPQSQANRQSDVGLQWWMVFEDETGREVGRRG